MNSYWVRLPTGDLVEVVYRADLGTMLVAALLLFLIAWEAAAWLWSLIRGLFT
ncbi:hypothetical protein [Caldinitratiruptor microaerophilus]|uniref:Uncharacterized protein n=1 Tax=Caldinitratiruptor microaerophilus TaxID=671077 RepID=A0AA35CKU3_9FIRM|nr:hypothetical protein [Caldinitratiruptor microaerophilus]BDG60268.1 hypothetical protein caldi_13580 [Caldinitratiruptor microaerophilus]